MWKAYVLINNNLSVHCEFAPQSFRCVEVYSDDVVDTPEDAVRVMECFNKSHNALKYGDMVAIGVSGCFPTFFEWTKEGMINVTEQKIKIPIDIFMGGGTGLHARRLAASLIFFLPASTQAEISYFGECLNHLFASASVPYSDYQYRAGHNFRKWLSDYNNNTEKELMDSKITALFAALVTVYQEEGFSQVRDIDIDSIYFDMLFCERAKRFIRENISAPEDHHESVIQILRGYYTK